MSAPRWLRVSVMSLLSTDQRAKLSFVSIVIFLNVEGPLFAFALPKLAEWPPPFPILQVTIWEMPSQLVSFSIFP